MAKDSKFVVHLDFDAIRNSKRGSTILKQAREEEESSQEEADPLPPQEEQEHWAST